MILRKQYAFLIKNFRLIHFFMLLISGYVLYRTNTAYRFFNDYANTRQFIESENLLNETLPMFLVLLSILLLAITITIFVLFRKKDKPTLVYLISILFYIAFTVIVIASRGILHTIILEGIDPRISRIVRDIWLICMIAEIILVGFYLIRALGFDVKKFNFGEDINELKIEDEDNEEFELNTGINKDKLRMRAAMQKEEFKAFYYENKFMIITILVLLIVVIPGVFVLRSVKANKRYTEKEVIKLNNFELSAVESFITKKNSKGEDIFKNDNSFLIVKIKLNNLSEKQRGIKLDNLRVEVNNKVYNPNITYYESFKDFGVGYNNQEVLGEKEYIAVYVIKDEDINTDMILRYADNITVKKKEANALYYRIILNPQKVDNNINKVTLEVGQTLTLPKDNTKFNVTHFNIKDKFTYEVNEKTRYIVNNVGLVLSLNYEYSSDSSNTVSDFLKNYGKIRYTLNNKNYELSIEDITPKGYNSNDIYIAVKEEFSEASNIYLVFNSRNAEYVYKLK